MAYIYRIWNDINNKSYIGKTEHSIEKRWKEHCADRTKIEVQNRPLYKAINKYGAEHFQIELIEECDEQKLAEREIYWIETYHSYSNGYNATLGGDGKILYDHDEMVTLYKNGLTCKDIAKQIGCGVDIVYNAVKKAGLDTHINAIQKNSHTIKGIFSDGSEKTFNSIQDAAQWLKDNNYTQAKDIRGIVTNISRVIKGKQHRNSYLKIKWVDA